MLSRLASLPAISTSSSFNDEQTPTRKGHTKVRDVLGRSKFTIYLVTIKGRPYAAKVIPNEADGTVSPFYEAEARIKELKHPNLI